MTDTVISVEHLSKRYRLGQIGATTLRESVERWVGRLRGRAVGELSSCQVAKLPRGTPSPNSTTQQPSNPATDSAELWALRDVSFEVKRGEVLGIIGRNGAGKSTLLKILTRITEPTSGRAVLRGRVASLLEVGTGFHPELTGRENIFLNGAILGMRKAEISAKFDEIVAFAEVEKFIDTPVKRYSSGMYVRLAFAVAAHLDPEILLVDEVLAVGDAGFQAKCMGKMGEVAREGRTILLVSHQLAAVENLCRNVCWIDKGEVRAMAGSDQVLSQYVNAAASRSDPMALAERADRTGTGMIRITSFHLEDASGRRTEAARSGSRCVFCFGFECRPGLVCKSVSLAFGVQASYGVLLFRNLTTEAGHDFVGVSGTGTMRCHVPRLPLSAGRYLLGFRACVDGSEADYISRDAAAFDVVAGDFFGTGKLSGHAPVLVDHSWTIDCSAAHAG